MQVKLTIDDGSKPAKTYSVEIPPGATVEDVFAASPVRAEMTPHHELGKWLDAVDGMPVNHDRFWLIYLNGSFAQDGVSFHRVHDGDEITARLRALATTIG